MYQYQTSPPSKDVKRNTQFDNQSKETRTLRCAFAKNIMILDAHYTHLQESLQDLQCPHGPVNRIRVACFSSTSEPGLTSNRSISSPSPARAHSGSACGPGVHAAKLRCRWSSGGVQVDDDGGIESCSAGCWES